MPRIARIQAPFCVRHLIVRFVNGENRFDQAPNARQEYLRRLGLALKKVDWSVLAFALMGNHGHLVRNRTTTHGRTALVQTWVALGRPITEIAPIIGISHQAAYQLTQKSIDSQLIKDLVKTSLLI
jgi:hypothetical protein